MNRHSALNSFFDSFSMYSYVVSPFRVGFRNPVKFYSRCIGSVSGLLRRCSPATIFFKVAKLSVYSVNRVFAAWRETHIHNKIFKLIPTFAPFNADTPVTRVCWGVFVITPGVNIFPNPILPGPRQAVRPGYFSYISRGWHALVYTASRFMMSTFEVSIA